MRTVALASGSNGNSIWVETASAKILFDAGLSGRCLARRADLCGVDLSSADALVLSHNHSDHSSGAGVIHRRYGAPVFATRGTWSVVGRRLGRIAGKTSFAAGDTLRFGKTTVRTLPTPHDGVEGVAFVVESDGRRLGILTDLGHTFPELREVLPTLEAAYIEANYDPDLLLTGPYPPTLRDRIVGPGGHLSNTECVDLALSAADARLRKVVLCHLSGENNRPDLAVESASPLSDRGVEVHLAGRRAPSEWLEV